MNEAKREVGKTEKPGPGAFKKENKDLSGGLIGQWIDEHYERPEDILAQEGLLAQLTKSRDGLRVVKYLLRGLQNAPS